MNKLFIAIIAAVGLFTGCSKKNNKNPSSSIVGKWYFVSDTINVYDNGTLSSSTPSVFKSMGYAQFNADGTGSESPVTLTVKFNYTVVDSRLLTLNYPTQKVDGVLIDAQTEQFTIKMLDSHNLYLFSDATVLDGGNSERTTRSKPLNKVAEAAHF
jgi:hypothetical protein